MDLTCSASPFFTSRLLGDPSGEGVTAVTVGTSLLGLTASSIDLKFSAVLIYFLGLQTQVSSVITNVSVIQSWNWFFHLSAFESVLLFFIIAKIGVLEILGILPINLTEFWEGTPTGRRKKRYALHPSMTHVAPPPATKEIGTKLLILYKKLDRNECALRALCELESKVTHDQNYEKRQLPRATLLVLRSLQSYAELEEQQQELNKRNSTGSTSAGNNGEKADESNSNGNSVDMHAALEPFVEAVKIGSQYGKSLSHGCNYLYKGSSSPVCSSSQVSNVCERKYPNCPVSSEEVLEYMERIDSLLQEL